MKFLPYEPDQAWLLPPSVKNVLAEDHLCFFVHQVVERLDLCAFAAGYSGEGQRPYAPAMMVKVWLYAYCLQVTSSRRPEQRLQEDLAFRYLAGGARPDHWALNDFRTRHRRAINGLFLPVVEVARGLGLARLGHVAIDSTRVHANASRRRTETREELRQRLAATRRRIRRWQQQCAADDPNEAPGTRVKSAVEKQLEEQVAVTREKLRKLRKLGARQLSVTDPDSRFLHQHSGGFVLGYTVDLAVSDSASLPPMVRQVEATCGQRPSQPNYRNTPRNW